jgi:hypothetical protein
MRTRTRNTYVIRTQIRKTPKADASHNPSTRSPQPVTVRESSRPAVDDTDETASRRRRTWAASPLSVHKHVDDLCATALGLCVDGGNAGDFATRPQPEQGFYQGQRE